MAGADPTFDLIVLITLGVVMQSTALTARILERARLRRHRVHAAPSECRPVRAFHLGKDMPSVASRVRSFGTDGSSSALSRWRA
jgi:hypothetical protein